MARKKQTQARKSAIKSYSAQRKRISKIVTRATKRGFRFAEGVIPKTVKEIVNLTTQQIKGLVKRLSEMTAPKVYQQSTAISESGEIVTGLEKRREERQEAAQKGQRTKYLQELGRQEEERKWQEFEDREDEDQSYSEWLERRKQKDEENQRRLKEEQEYQRQFQMGEIVYNQVQQMIQSIGEDHKQAAYSLLMELQDEINKFGREKVMMAISEAPTDYIEAAQVALRYNPGDERHTSAIAAMWTIIKGGEVMSAEESARISEQSDADASFTPPSDE